MTSKGSPAEGATTRQPYKKRSDRISAMDRHVAGRIRFARMSRHLTQKEIAEAVGVGHSQMEKWERAQNALTATRIHQLARVLHVSPGWFFEGFGPDEAAGIRLESDADLATQLPADALRLARDINGLTTKQRGMLRQMIDQMVLVNQAAGGDGGQADEQQ